MTTDTTRPTDACIVGIGATEFSKASGRSELRLAIEASLAALADAGIDRRSVDGLTTFTYDKNPEIDVARALGIDELRFFSRVPYGGGAACAVVQQAALAVESGTADVVIAYRALNMRSGARAGSRAGAAPVGNSAEDVARSWYGPFGLRTPAAMAALFARRYMYRYGATSEDFGRVSVLSRQHAATNPAAWFTGRPITLAEHQESRWIVDPLRLLDCCQESDGAVALVITTRERARDLPTVAAVVEAAAQGSTRDQHEMTSYYRSAETVADLPEMALVSRSLYAQANIRPDDIRTAVLYDHFTPYVLPQLEAFGFCGPGEAAGFMADGHAGLNGSLPINTHGGQLGEGYLHGMNGVMEAVRQLRGTSPNQLSDVEHVLVSAGAGVPTSGLILGRSS